MALVPFRASGPAADQSAEERLVQFVCPTHVLALRLKQHPAASGSLRGGQRQLRAHQQQRHGGSGDDEGAAAAAAPATAVTAAAAGSTASIIAGGPGPGGAGHGMPPADAEGSAAGVQWPHDDDKDTANKRNATAAAAATGSSTTTTTTCSRPELANVGLVVWQSGYVLAELLLRMPPFGPSSWHDVHVMDLGTGTGITGLALALAGARVTLTDLPHILPLARENAAANCGRLVAEGRVACVEHRWGEGSAQLVAQVGAPDIITAADVLYDPAAHGALLHSIRQLSAPHTVTYVAYRMRQEGEEGFAGMAEASGFHVDRLDPGLLQEEYRGGEYQVLRLARLDDATDIE